VTREKLFFLSVLLFACSTVCVEGLFAETPYGGKEPGLPIFGQPPTVTPPVQEPFPPGGGSDPSPGFDDYEEISELRTTCFYNVDIAASQNGYRPDMQVCFSMDPRSITKLEDCGASPIKIVPVRWKTDGGLYPYIKCDASKDPGSWVRASSQDAACAYAEGKPAPIRCGAEASATLEQSLSQIQRWIKENPLKFKAFCMSLPVGYATSDMTVRADVLRRDGLTCGACSVLWDPGYLPREKDIGQSCVTVGGNPTWSVDVNYAMHGLLSKACSPKFTYAPVGAGTIDDLMRRRANFVTSSLAYVWKNLWGKHREYSDQLAYWLRYGSYGGTVMAHVNAFPFPTDERYGGLCPACPYHSTNRTTYGFQIGLEGVAPVPY
jgi:hypothetical protein